MKEHGLTDGDRLKLFDFWMIGALDHMHKTAPSEWPQVQMLLQERAAADAKARAELASKEAEEMRLVPQTCHVFSAALQREDATVAFQVTEACGPASGQGV